MKHKLTLAVMTVLLTISLSSAAAYADTVTVTLTNPVQFIDAGETLTYEVNITADAGNSADVFLNGGTFSGGVGLGLDATDFILNAPIFLTRGESSGPFDAFTVTVLAGTTPGNYSGFFIVRGGVDGNAQDALGQNAPGGEAFVTTVTPEPSSFLLLGSGLAGLVGVVRRKRSM